MVRTIFDLPDFRVIDAVDDDDGGRWVLIGSLAPPGCPSCGAARSGSMPGSREYRDQEHQARRRGFRNENYRARILLTSADKTAA